MIKRITIDDYMAHQHTVLELGPGVTVLTGPNNVGKSAVVEAIRSVAQNPAPEHVVRHGARQALVRVELDSGEVIEWVRKKSNAVYRLYRPWPAPANEATASIAGSEPVLVDSPPGLGEPEVYAKFGRTPPDDIRDLLRLDLVETDSDPVDIHIGNQRYPVFLLDQAGSQAASFFAASTEAEYLLRMRQALKVRTDSSRRQVNQLRLECGRMEKELERHLPLDGIDTDLNRMEQLYGVLQDLRQSLPRLAAAIQTLAETERQSAAKQRCGLALIDLMEAPLSYDTTLMAARLEEWERTLGQQRLTEVRSGVLKPLVDPPELHHTVPLEALLVALEQVGGALACSLVQESALHPLAAPPAIHDAASLEQLVRQWRAAAYQLHVAARSSDVLGRLAAAPEPNDLGGCEALLEVLEETTAHFTRVVQRRELLDDLQPCPKPSDTVVLEDMLGRLTRLEQALLHSDQDRQACDAALDSHRREMQAALAEAGSCPLCGQILDATHFLEVVHD
jgi:hypothetical protein